MEMIRHFNEMGIAGEMSLTADPTAEILETFGSGFWSTKQAQAFCDDWVRLVRSVHAVGRRIAVLAIMSDCAVQTPEVTEILAKSNRGLFQDGDSIAMLVPSSLAKMQTRRILDNSVHGFFISSGAARMWLSSRGFPAAEHFSPKALVA